MMYKVKKPRDLRLYSTEELKKMLQDIGATMQLMRGQKEQKMAINPGQWRNIKKTKARILTILREREGS